MQLDPVDMMTTKQSNATNAELQRPFSGPISIDKNVVRAMIVGKQVEQGHTIYERF